jgi:hypothetical protein
MFKYVKSRDSKKNVNSTASETAEAISIQELQFVW